MAAATGGGGGFPALASLYRAILRTHRAKLPGPLRVLGDSYAGEEMRRHLRPEAKTSPAQWAEFAAQWRAYVAALNSQPSAAAMPDVTGLELTAEQRQQLGRLQQAAQELARGGSGEPPASQPPLG